MWPPSTTGNCRAAETQTEWSPSEPRTFVSELMVRRKDERAAELNRLGAEVVTGDLLHELQLLRAKFPSSV
jgi:hypothetical protein